jgi:hypothetical protein
MRMREVEGHANFNKIIICSGVWGRPECHCLRVNLYSKERSFVDIHPRRRANFKGKAVAVLGIGNNTPYIATALVGNTSRIYLSHRGGVGLVALLPI